MRYLSKLALLGILGASIGAGSFSPAVGAAEVQDQPQYQHYRYRLEAYDHGRLTATLPYETYASSQQQLQVFLNNKLAVWGQLLSQQGIPWNRLTPVFLGN